MMMMIWLLSLISPLNGVEVESVPERVFAVVVDNSPSARPQSGISFASVVYEIPVEGGITRLLALYFGNEPSVVGPVRSLRKYMIPIIQEYDALIAHCGGDPGSWYEVALYSLPAFNELEGKGKYFRSTDRKAPHNLYLKLPETRIEAVKRGLQKGKQEVSGPFLISSQATMTSEETQYVKIPYASGKISNYVEWKYDAESGLYYRWVNGVLQKDRLNGKVISTRHIIIQRVWKKQVEGPPTWRIDLGILGTGNGWVITGGKREEIFWKKSSRERKTQYHYPDGTRVVLTPGTIWVEIVPDTVEITFSGG
ncbi:MAG: DUF3048 domain-containing protein [bacterium]